MCVCVPAGLSKEVLLDDTKAGGLHVRAMVRERIMRVRLRKLQLLLLSLHHLDCN